jgi:hypothetical protein
MRRSSLIDETGNCYERWTVLSRAPKGNAGEQQWHCVCTCGETRIVMQQSLRNGTSKSCGCFKVEQHTKHGHASSANPHFWLYRIWEKIKDRTTNPANKTYARYGGRGIQMATEWKDNFETFRDYMVEHLGTRPDDDYSLDRIENNLGYQPGNLKWSTKTEQSFNRRKFANSSSQYRGVSWHKSLAKWVSSIKGYGKSTYLGTFTSELEAALVRDIGVVRHSTPAILNFPELLPTYQQYIVCEEALKTLEEPTVPKKPSQSVDWTQRRVLT